jgi:predicted secreted protein
MKKVVKITAISAAAIVVILTVLFVVIPFASSKKAEERLAEALTGAGIPEDMWSAKRVYYIPIFGHLVVEKFEIGGILEANKIMMVIKTNSEDIITGAINAQGLSFSADGIGIIVKSISVKDFSVNTMMFGYSPLESVKRLEKVTVRGTTFRQGG